MQDRTGATPSRTIDEVPDDFEFAVAAAAAAEATADQLALLDDHRSAWRWTLERLLHRTDEDLAAVRSIGGPEREQIVADFESERDRLEAALSRLLGSEDGSADPTLLESAGEVRLQASWAAGRLVVWAAGPGTEPSSSEELERRLEAVGVLSSGWTRHPPVKLPSGSPAPALALPIGDALGWLMAVGGGHDDDAIGSSVTWLGRVAVWAVRLVADGSIVPTLRTRRRGRNDGDTELVELSVRWVPALLGTAELEELADAMPGPVTALERTTGRQLTQTVLSSIVHAIASDAAARLTMPAPPPDPRDPVSVAEAVLTRLDGSSFEVPARVGAEIAKRFERWSSGVTTPSDARLVVTLEPPDRDGAWFLSVSGPDQDGQLVPLEVALVESRPKRHLPDELARLERLMPVLKRPGEARRGQVVLSQDEAWELMTQTGPLASAAGFDVRVPALSRTRPKPALRLDTIAADPSVVGAHQLAQVRWSAVFGDVELDAKQIAELASEARPLVRSHGRWVELDRVDLAEAAAALAERAEQTQLTGAEVLRHAIGLEESPLAGGFSVAGSGWATDLLARAEEMSSRTDHLAGRLRGGAPLLPGRGRRLAGLPRRCRARRLSRPRHGPGQDADDAGAHRPHRRERPGVGRRATGGRGELGGRGGTVHAGAVRGRAPRGTASLGARARVRGRGRRRGHHDLRHRGA